MAHDCPTCESICYCDMDDCWFENPPTAAEGGCRHKCPDNDPDDYEELEEALDDAED